LANLPGGLRKDVPETMKSAWLNDVRASGQEEIHPHQKSYRYVSRLRERMQGNQYQVAGGSSGAGFSLRGFDPCKD